ncbi:MAG TPA: fibronectin type III-like domain-contianing protein, partial [Chloroflexota bacterium]|nr:fibronectin type III-like domain-contianing protein [Chloroflexota bacterium]
TQFDLHNLQVDKQAISANEAVQISLTVTNTGARDGDEVVQLYVWDKVASVTRPLKELKGFQRVTVPAGASRTVTFTLFANQLGFYDGAMRQIVEPGIVELMVGISSDDIRLHTQIEIVGETQEIPARQKFFSEVQVV